MIYTTERHEAKVAVDHYLAEYVDVEGFLQKCRECPNYDRIWSCPPYDFDVIEYWKRFSVLELIAIKIVFDEDHAGKLLPEEEIEKITVASIGKVKEELTRELYAMERAVPGSVSLSAGSCSLCKGGCTRPAGQTCRFSDKMRFSIESLGGNVGLTTEKLMEIELEWMQEGRLPSYFVLVCGLLRP